MFLTTLSNIEHKGGVVLIFLVAPFGIYLAKQINDTYKSNIS